MVIIIIIIIIIINSSGITLLNLIYNYQLHQSNYRFYQLLLIDKFANKLHVPTTAAYICRSRRLLTSYTL
jgi:hypothetical protein